MSDDGADLGYKAEDGMKAALGDDPPKERMDPVQLERYIMSQLTWEEYASLPAPVYGGRSAQQLIDEGQCEEVLNALWALLDGAYV